MGTYAIQNHGKDGSGITHGAVVEAGDNFSLDGGNIQLSFLNSDASSYDATIAGQGLDNNGRPNPDLVITVPANTTGQPVKSPLLRADRFGAAGVATVTYEAGATGNVTAAAVRVNDDKTYV